MGLRRQLLSLVKKDAILKYYLKKQLEDADVRGTSGCMLAIVYYCMNSRKKKYCFRGKRIQQKDHKKRDVKMFERRGT